MNRICLVTGAGSGVGRAAALALLGDGDTVYLAGRRMEPLQETAAMATGGTAIPVTADVTDPASVGAMFDRIRSEKGRLDVLFNNAGISTRSINFGDLTWEQWRDTLSVNLDGMFLCASAAFRMMRDQAPQGGRIINNGSISAHAPRPGSAPYTASKHAVTGLTRSISLDGRAFGVACGQVDIGNAATAMTKVMTAGVPQADGRMAVEPRMDVDDVGRTILFMASMPADANVQFVTVMATNMPFIGRG
ncbi:SDR family oxidoreductase [Acidisoma cellulosilytica]|uniref:SDR family oxidoreductase n=1 Tax=Acidisoma cellulosilyticum TaxID=2802395 RepID=A0A964E2L4_9PROT|nr:SDR family oxidoreductase [Acidisoma cellulosilyticum]MCB8878943.1 SDR family oxidoreductase [Acidisoma cellulosilyticum]